MRLRLLSALLAPPAWAALFLSAAGAEDLEETYRQARARQDWATAAEAAIRRLEAEPGRPDVLGLIARARFQEGDLASAEAWLTKWEAATLEPTAATLALRGDLSRANDAFPEARSFWLRSYELQPEGAVARRLMDPRLWEPEERPRYETLMESVATEFQFVPAVEVAAETALRRRDWEAVAAWTHQLNTLGTRPAMKAAARLERALADRESLIPFDDGARDLESGLGHARRAHFFFTQEFFQLAREDAREALARTPGMVLPKITLANSERERGEREAAAALRVVLGTEDTPDLTDAQRLTLDRLDYEVSQSPVPPATYLKRARALAAAGQPYLALDDLETGGPALTRSAEAWAARGQCHLVLNEAAPAREAFERALALEPSASEAWTGLAHLAMDRADYPEAIHRYEWLLRHEPAHKSHANSLQQARARTRAQSQR